MLGMAKLVVSSVPGRGADMFEIEGLDRLTRELDQFSKALAELDGEITEVQFDPSDPASIEHSKKEIEAQPRARQNVVLELGYFVGKLGRDRVCALKKGILEIPSDYLGVVYTDLDESGGWRLKLAQELQAAGYDINWNKIMGRG
jgi:predicted nucleotide-binding protein